MKYWVYIIDGLKGAAHSVWDTPEDATDTVLLLLREGGFTRFEILASDSKESGKSSFTAHQ